jgi:hypothetical protein
MYEMRKWNGLIEEFMTDGFGVFGFWGFGV